MDYRCLSTLAVFFGLLRSPVVGCLAGRPSHIYSTRNLVRKQVFLPLSYINSMVGKNSEIDLVSFSKKTATSLIAKWLVKVLTMFLRNPFISIKGL